MRATKSVQLPYGRAGLSLAVPAETAILEAAGAPALADPAAAVRAALLRPIGSAPLAELLAARQVRHAAITISDSTRPVPNRVFLPVLLEVLNRAGLPDRRITIIIGTGLHRPSTPAEREVLLGREVAGRCEVLDHQAARPETLARVSADPKVSVNRRFAEADFRIVTGFIEGHFMAGFSGGRKGVCPALVDLETVQRFHGCQTLAHPLAAAGVLAGNPCHQLALAVARTVGVDFLLNVALARDRQVAGVYAGDLEAAHERGCADVAAWNTVAIDAPYDLVITSGGGHPLDQTFYQTVKGICAALPALHERSVLLAVADCGEGVGSDAYTDLMRRYRNDWRGFLRDIAASAATALDQWQFQMQGRVLARINVENLWFASDGLPLETQRWLAVRPLEGAGSARERAQRALDSWIAEHPGARIAVLREGPYAMVRRAGLSTDR